MGWHGVLWALVGQLGPSALAGGRLAPGPGHRRTSLSGALPGNKGISGVRLLTSSCLFEDAALSSWSMKSRMRCGRQPLVMNLLPAGMRTEYL